MPIIRTIFEALPLQKAELPLRKKYFNDFHMQRITWHIVKLLNIEND